MNDHATTTDAQPPEPWRQRAAFSLFVDAHPDASGPRRWRLRLYREESGDELVLPAAALSRALARYGVRLLPALLGATAGAVTGAIVGVTVGTATTVAAQSLLARRRR